MVGAQANTLLRQFQDHRASRDLSDRELLWRFAARHDEAAFAALVRRHGPMVLRVCRCASRQEQDAEDAFQATFLVLARKASSVHWQESAANWLYGVARRVARKARDAADRRRQHERRAPVRAHADPLAELSVREAEGLLHEELGRLPQRYRAPLVLCYLEGQTQDETARQLGWSKSTCCRRLERGRELLRIRLARRGLALSAVLLPSGLTPAALVASTVQAALAPATAGVAPATVLNLADAGAGVVSTVKLTLAAVVLAVCLAAGAGAMALQGGSAKPLPPTPQRTQRPHFRSLQDFGSGVPPRADDKRKPRTDRFGDPLPKGALARLGTLRLRHYHSYMFLYPAFSPDGKVLATGGNGEIRLWDTATGKLLREISDGYGYGELFFAPNGRWLAGRRSGRGPRSTRLWNPNTGRRLLDIPGGWPRVCSSDGKQLVTATEDGTVSLWDIATGKRTAHLRGGHEKVVTSAAFTADGKGLVTFCVGRRACHWDLKTSTLRKTVAMPVPRRVHRLCLSPNGQSLAVSPRDGAVFLLDTTTGKQRLKLQGEAARGGYGLAFSPDGKTLATSTVVLTKWVDDTTVALWDATTGKLLRRLRMPWSAARHLCFSPDGRTLLTAGGEPLVHLWDVTTGKPLHQWPAHEGIISTLAFTPDGGALVSGSHDGSVRLWEVKSGRQSRKLKGHFRNVSAVAVTPDGKTVVSGGTDGCIRVQTTDGRKGRRILLGRPPEELDEPDAQVYALGLSPDGKTAVTYSLIRNPARSVYHVWDLSTGKAIHKRRDPSKVISTRLFSPDARLVLQHVQVSVGDANGTAKGFEGPPSSTLAVLSDVTSGKQVHTLAQPKDASHVGAFTPDGRTLLTISCQNERRADGWHHDNTILLWELASGKERQTIRWSGPGRFNQVAVAPDGRTLAVARDDGVIQLWDIATGKLLLRRTGFGGRRYGFGAQVQCLAFAPDGRSLASGHSDGTILIWDLSAVDRAKRPAKKADARQIERWRADLFGDDARKAHAALWALAAEPTGRGGVTPPLLKPVAAAPTGRGGVTPPLQPAPPEKLRRLIAELDGRQFQRRKAAVKELAALGEQAVPALRAALKADPSAEQRRRIEETLSAIRAAHLAESLRQVRAVEVLERIGTEQARKLLREWAGGAPAASLTKEARTALRRLERLDKPRRGKR